MPLVRHDVQRAGVSGLRVSVAATPAGAKGEMMILDEETTFGEWLRWYRSEHGGRGPHCGDAWVAGRESMRGAFTEQLAVFSRLQSEHSDLIERERVLEAELAQWKRQNEVGA